MRVALLIIVCNVYFVCGILKYVDFYETLSYIPVSTRVKRSLDGSKLPINVQFTSHNRTFQLILKPDEDSSVFDTNLVIVENGKPVDVDRSKFLVHGYEKSDRGSEVYGSILDGVFDGHIHFSNGESFTVDKVGKFLSINERKKHYHSIIYTDGAINHPKFRRKRSLDDAVYQGCGLTEEVKQNMERIQRSVVIEDAFHEDFVDGFHPSYDRQFYFVSYYFGSIARNKRDIDAVRSMDETKIIDNLKIYTVRTCNLYIQADHKLYEHIYEKEGNRDEVRTREEIVNLVNSHLQALNSIYRSTNFEGIYGINFIIFSSSSCLHGKPTDKMESNPFCDDNVDVSNYLNLNSRKNHSDFCLAYALTFRDFFGGTLGLAWVASPNHNTAGGVCQQYTKYSESSNFVYRSLNTGIVTFINYGSRVPSRVSQLTLAHEIGHNFGSPHDFPYDCQPGLPDGNFLMFASATSGDKKNNAKFSRCSVANISLVLKEVLQQPPISGSTARYRPFAYAGGPTKRNCFMASTQSFCGNQLKEKGEECDCGYSEEECTLMHDKCCYPRESGSKGCKRREYAQCSISEGICCKVETCTFEPAEEQKVCRKQSDCLEEQICDGTSAVCPPSMPKEDGTLCRDSTKVCHDGNCNGSLCVYLGMKDCFLTNGTPEQLCHLACEDANGTCKSSFHLPQFSSDRFNQSTRGGLPGLILLPGSPCNNYKGYCDIFRKCRSVDADGPLARLKNVIFNPRTIEGVKSWIQLNWWVVVLGGLGLLLFVAVFIKCCAVHTPSTNPNKAPALSLYETLRRPKTLIYSQTRHRPAAEQGNGRVRRHHRQSDRGRSSQAAVLQAMPSAPPAVQAQIPTNIVVVEPPPPYSASNDPGTALGGPKRGHRKNKRKSGVEMRVKNRRN